MPYSAENETSNDIKTELKGENWSAQIKIIEKKIKQQKLLEAKQIAKKLLKDTKEQERKIIVLQKLLKIAHKEQDYERGRKLKKVIKSKEKIVEKIEIKREQSRIELRQNRINKQVVAEIGFEEKRTDLYEGKINESQLKEIAEENNSTVGGCIFIAETCKYFKLEQLGLKCLNGIRKKDNITDNERKAICKAEELLKSKNVLSYNREQWDNAYGKLGMQLRLLPEAEEYLNSL